MTVVLKNIHEINGCWRNKLYSFYYIDKNDERNTFYGLSERTAKHMYKLFLRDSVIHGYKQVGWQKNDGSYATGISC